MANDDFELNTNKFLVWAHENGLQISSKCSLTDLTSQDRGRGLIASSNLEEDEVILKIPRNAVLDVDSARHRLSTSAAKVVKDMPAWLSLTIVMMSETQRGDSRWSPYFAVLPSKLDSLIFWSPSELMELQASAVLHKIGKSDAEAIFYKEVEPLCLFNSTVELFHQMASMIMAYAFDIPQDPRSDSEDEKGEMLVVDEDQLAVLAMIPFADMLNADAQLNNARLIYDNDYLEMCCIKNIKEGEEIFNDYGSLPRSDLLRRYGYITDNYAPYDVAELSMKFIISTFQTGLLLHAGADPLRLQPADLEMRSELARREDMYDDSYDINHASSDGPCIPDKLVAFIYLLIVDARTLVSILKSDSELPVRREMTTELLGRVMVNLLRLREGEYETTLEEDDEILRTGISSRRKEMAIKVRRGEKAVLREARKEAASFRGSNIKMWWTGAKREALEDAPNPNKRSKIA